MATARGDRIAPLENPADVIQGLAAKIDELPQAEYPYYGGTHDGLMAALRSGVSSCPARSIPPESLVNRLETALR